MARREYSTEEVVMASDVLGYMLENEVSLETAYQDKMVPEEMRLSEEDINEIREKYLA